MAKAFANNLKHQFMKRSDIKVEELEDLWELKKVIFDLAAW